MVDSAARMGIVSLTQSQARLRPSHTPTICCQFRVYSILITQTNGRLYREDTGDAGATVSGKSTLNLARQEINEKGRHWYISQEQVQVRLHQDGEGKKYRQLTLFEWLECWDKLVTKKNTVVLVFCRSIMRSCKVETSSPTLYNKRLQWAIHAMSDIISFIGKTWRFNVHKASS